MGVATLLLCLIACAPDPDPAITDGDGITMTVSSVFFRPALGLNQPATLYINWGDGSAIETTEAAAGDHVFARHDFVTGDSSHSVELWVEPWTALEVLNLGFRAGDGGNDTVRTDVPVISLFPPNSAFAGVNDGDVLDADRVRGYVGTVTGVENLQVATALEAFCCEQQAITSLDCSGLASLRNVEAFYSTVKSTNFQGCAALRRCCLESTGANASWRIIDGHREESAALDLGDSPLLQDIRGTGDDHDLLIIHPDALNSIWHLCKMGNTRMSTVQVSGEAPAKLDLTRFNALTQCWISYTPVLQDLVLNNGVTNSFWLSKTGVKTVDIHGQTQVEELELNENLLTSIDLGGCTGLSILRLGYCSLSQTMTDQVLADLDALGTQGGSWRQVVLADTADLTDTRRNAPPSVAGLAHVQNLRDRGWTVTVNE